MTSYDNDDLMMFTMDPLNNHDEDHEDDDDDDDKPDLSTSDYHSFVAATDTSILIDSSMNHKNKMCDITEYLGPSTSSFDDKQDLCQWFDKLQPISTSSPSLNINNYLRSEQDFQWQIEENCLKYDSKDLSPSDYSTRQSLYNRPVAFEKDSRTWARNLLDNFKKSTQSSYMKFSPSFDQHIHYIEHLNECNDYPAYLEYLNENRSQLFYTLTDSLDIIDGLLGTVVSSF